MVFPRDGGRQGISVGPCRSVVCCGECEVSGNPYVPVFKKTARYLRPAMRVGALDSGSEGCGRCSYGAMRGSKSHCFDSLPRGSKYPVFKIFGLKSHEG